MKGRLIYIIIIILLALILIFNRTNSINMETDKSELTEEQIEKVNKAFQPIIIGDDGTDKLNPLGHFLTSYYEKPENIDLDNMLYQFPTESNIADGEFEALKTHDNWPFGEVTSMENIPVPIHRIPASSVDAALNQYMNISLNDLNTNNFSSLIFLEEYNAFYNFTSDFSPGFFICNSGEIKGDTVVLYGKNAILTLKKLEDRYIFVSHIKAE